jgi:recombination protein RecT
MTNEITTQNNTLDKILNPTLTNLVLGIKPEMMKFGIDNSGADRFLRIALHDLAGNQKLAQCNPYSILGSLLSAAQLGLEPNSQLGECYIFPQKNGTARFQIGYQGYIKLFRNQDDGNTITAHKVYETDEIEIDEAQSLISQKIKNFNDRGKVIGYYAIAKTKNETNILYLSKVEMDKRIVANPERYQSDAWKTDYDAMAMKTILGDCLSYMPAEIRKYACLDGAVINYNPETKMSVVDVTEMPNEFYKQEVKQ